MTDSDATAANTLVATLRKFGYDLEDPSDRASSTSSSSSSSSSAHDANASSTRSSTPRVSSSSILQLRERKNDQTALHIAAKKGHIDVLKALRSLPRSGDYVNVGDRHANTALHFAASCANKEQALPMVELLLRMGANVNAVNVRGQTPLLTHLLTCRDDDPTITQELMERGMATSVNEMVHGTTYLHTAVEKNLMQIAGALVASGASINVADSTGATVSDVIAHKALIKLICCMHEGTQAQDAGAVRNYCKICKAHRGLLDTFTDCNLCGRTVCKNCSSKASEVKAAATSAASNKAKDKETKPGRLCKTCCTVVMVRDKKLRQKETFNEHLFGCGMK